MQTSPGPQAVWSPRLNAEHLARNTVSPLASAEADSYYSVVSESNNLHALLEKHFGFREFLEGQQSVVAAILNGEDALVIMPTGGGKSLCYQLPALALDGITVVVSPLIALMKDQVDGLVEKGIPATFINSTLSQSEMDERIRAMVKGTFRLVYIAPERFKSERFVAALSPLSIALFAVDEAHCISQWGHDFRPDYLRLKWALKELGQPQVIALTATATPEVREDIVEQLSLGRFGRQPPRVFVSGFARHNLTLGVTSVKGKAAKLERITECIRQLQTGIVYCATRKNVEKVAAHLAEQRIACIAYHGGMTDDQRQRAQDQFMGPDAGVGVAVATNAFGMGIDRPDLRFVIHYDIPGSVEAYYQEAGRAGRDGEPARCEMLYNYADVRTQEFFIEGANPTREIIANLHRTLYRLCSGGPIEMPIEKIAEQVPAAKNEMAVGTALYLLERAGFIHRDYRQGSRTYTTRLVDPEKPLDELPIDFERLDAKRERDFEQAAPHHRLRRSSRVPPPFHPGLFRRRGSGAPVQCLRQLPRARHHDLCAVAHRGRNRQHPESAELRGACERTASAGRGSRRHWPARARRKCSMPGWTGSRRTVCCEIWARTTSGACSMC